ncbi:hypothetical protein GCM10009841_15290 [Microlunatus panaciterrae]|uniref:Uncharacterized protein n=1 Tax=Microlunatus panaciterrae TaxID=400768 RepID=A0ABS2RN58_9ACTN|nr:hypothetical protein [Microlunatus panaciterrae]MBM7800088.1 hypothetical protein [Microlunatus panaciterrae]
MSRHKLTIIVTCTDRKSATPDDELMVRNLPTGQVSARARVWKEGLARATVRRPLIDLYGGETWSQVRALALKATNLRYEPTMFVVSAGLGLQHVSTSAPAYAATFSTGHADSVGASLSESQTWWGALPHADVPLAGRAIWVLSEAYSRVVGQQLLEDTAPSDVLVFGGSKEIRDSLRVPSDRSLRRALGGTVTSLNVRAATQWLSLSDGKDPFTSAARDKWRTWSHEKRHREVFDRKPMSDSAVVAFVRELRVHQPTVSKTGALKVLREAGMACEQRRFSTLFQQAVTR